MLRKIPLVRRLFVIPPQLRVPTHPIAERRLLYVEVPKAGCSSVKHSLERFRPACRQATDPTDWHRRFGYHHLHYHRLALTLKVRYWHFRIFTVVRNPYARFLSYYAQRVLGKQQRKVSLDEYLDEFTAEHGPALAAGQGIIDTHCRPQHLIIGEDLSLYDFIGRTEDMPAVFRYLEAVIGEPVKHLHNNKSRGSSFALSAEQKKKIYALYERDFTLLGYEK